MIRAVRPGVVPYIASWSAEHPLDLTVIERPGAGIGYLGETALDRDTHVSCGGRSCQSAVRIGLSSARFILCGSNGR